MVPIILIPVINGFDLLRRCLLSIPEPGITCPPVVLVNNSPADIPTEVLDGLPYTPSVIGIRKNLGVSASWNILLRATSICTWGVICASDMKLSPGWSSILRKSIECGNELITTKDFGFGLFAITESCVRKAGLFDENFFPAYLEDVDYEYRMRLSGVKTDDVQIPGIIHGVAPKFGSTTIYSDSRAAHANRFTHNGNFKYYSFKWGGIPGKENYITPYNSSSDVQLCINCYKMRSKHQKIWETWLGFPHASFSDAIPKLSIELQHKE